MEKGHRMRATKQLRLSNLMLEGCSGKGVVWGFLIFVCSTLMEI